jgi:23S rRNA pseudouridine1911/1915/1917 synthase
VTSPVRGGAVGDPGGDARRRAVVVEEGRLDVAVAALLPELSRSQAARLVREGRVTLDGVPASRPSAQVAVGVRIEVDLPPARPAGVVAQDLPLRIVYQDEDVAVIDKDAGVVVHPSAGHADGTLVNALLHHLEGLSGVGGEERPGIVHRLDRGTSGLIVVAKHDRAHRSLAAQFAAHTAGRSYLALVHDPPASDRGTVESYLARHPRDRLRQASTSPDRGRRAVTHWTVLGRAGTVGLLLCRLETGRTHQVRVHLAESGWAILGDRLYRRGGSAVPASIRALVDDSGDRPLLHAWKLAFAHPVTGERLEWTAEPPADFRAVAEALGLSATARRP